MVEGNTVSNGDTQYSIQWRYTGLGERGQSQVRGVEKWDTSQLSNTTLQRQLGGCKQM